MRVLIVRLSSLGDVVHTLPVAAALRTALPDAAIDWVVDERNADLLALVPVLDRVVVLRTRSRSAIGAFIDCRHALRRRTYDVALDVQGLGKSAFVARLSGARRVVGFTPPFLRERWSGLFHTETADPGRPTHVVDRNLGLLTALGIEDARWAFPLEVPPTGVPEAVERLLDAGDGRFALINPNTAWPNKCWPPARFGTVAARVLRTHGLRSIVLWGPGDEARAEAVVAGSDGAASLAPRTDLADLVTLLRAGTVLVSGDTGPLHIAAAVGTPVVGIYGPSNPARNGPWSPHDIVVSRFTACGCHKERDRTGPVGRMVRHCEASTWCLDDITVDEVCAAVDRRIESLVDA